jgi:mRNA interferase RelE/StbE
MTAERVRRAVYRIELAPAASRQLRKLDPDVRGRLSKRIDALATNPRPSGVEKLEGEEGFCRVRAGDYRIIYTIEDQVLLVVVVKVGHRSDIYRALRRR